MYKRSLLNSKKEGNAICDNQSQYDPLSLFKKGSNQIDVPENHIPEGIEKIGNNNSTENTIANQIIDDIEIIPQDQVTMISGFFSAINSFAKKVGNFGDMKELKMNNIKFSFYRPNDCDYLLFVGASDTNLSQNIIQSVLKNVSSEFLRIFPDVLHPIWNGKTDKFKNFKPIIKRIMHEFELNYIDSLHTENKVSPKNIAEFRIRNNRFDHRMLSRNIEFKNKVRRLNSEIAFKELRNREYVPYSKEIFYGLIPLKKMDEIGDYSDLFSGRDSRSVFHAINGRNTVEDIARLTGLKNDRTFNLCKCFIKMGLISFTK